MPKCDFNKIGFPKNTSGGLLLYHFCQVEYVWEYASCKEFILINSYNETEIFQQYLQEFLLMYFRGLYLCYCLGSLRRMLIHPVKSVRGRMFLHSDFLEDWMMLLLFGECWTFLLVQVKKSLNCSALFWGFVTVLLSISNEEGPFVYFALFEWIMSWIHGYNFSYFLQSIFDIATVYWPLKNSLFCPSTFWYFFYFYSFWQQKQMLPISGIEMKKWHFSRQRLSSAFHLKNSNLLWRKYLASW